jgi:taurine dioxygenase
MIRDSRQLKPGHVEDWHSDGSYKPRPPAYTLLHAQTVPDHGGDTLWANTTLAHQLLSAPLQQLVAGLAAVHETDTAGAVRHATHPLVRTDVHGRPALYSNPLYTRRIEALTRHESDKLLALLHLHMQQPEHTCRHRWAPHDLVLWDNRRTMHRAIQDYDPAAGRVLHRVTINSPSPTHTGSGITGGTDPRTVKA